MNNIQRHLAKMHVLQEEINNSKGFRKKDLIKKLRRMKKERDEFVFHQRRTLENNNG